MNKKRLCCFYVNDIHLITMLLPYINERINESTEIITVLESDISKSVKKVIDGIHKKRAEILSKMDWRSKKITDLHKIDMENKLILIYGTDEFINEANTIINHRSENCEILNCYEIMQGSTRLQEILDEHDKVVNTAGEKYPEEVFIGYTPKSYTKITVS